MDRVVTEEGEESNSIRDIERILRNYFANIYASEADWDDKQRIQEAQDFCSLTPRLDEDAPTLTEAVTPEELELVIKNMSNGATPGVDGLPAEFYRACFAQMTTALRDLFNAILKQQLLPRSFSDGRLQLLAKEGQDLRRPASWRLITLLNADCKTFTALLTRRLQRVLPDIVSKHQFCLVPASIFPPLNLARDVIEYTNGRSAPGLITNLDHEKAFDRLEHGYMMEVLRSHGIPETFTRLLTFLYKDMKSDILINGRTSPRFAVARG